MQVKLCRISLNSDQQLLRRSRLLLLERQIRVYRLIQSMEDGSRKMKPEAVTSDISVHDVIRVAGC